MNIYHQESQAICLLEMSSKLLWKKRNGMNNTMLPGVKAIMIMLLLVIMTSFFTPLVHAANLLFRSNLGSGISLGSLYGYSTYGAWQAINGTDKETGYTWPVSALGSNFSGIQLITVDPITSSTIGNYISNEIRSVTGPKGTPVNELFQQVKIKGVVGTGGSQAPLVINRPWNIGDVNDLYITYWFKYPADFVNKLDNTVSTGNWRVQFEFKTGGYNNTYAGDYRIITNIVKDSDGKLYWKTDGDNMANGPWSKVLYWSEENHAVPVPIDKWFKYEVYWHRSSGSDGRFWSAVNGQVIVDYHGPNVGDYNLPITRIMVNNPYSGGYATVESHSTGLQIWNGFPCGVEVSCFNYDTAPPTPPSSLAAKISKYSTAAGVSLSWNVSADNIAVAGYNIYRNEIKIAVTTTNKYNDVLSGSAKGTLYKYTVKAFDAEDNLSAASSAALVTY